MYRWYEWIMGMWLCWCSCVCMSVLMYLWLQYFKILVIWYVTFTPSPLLPPLCIFNKFYDFQDRWQFGLHGHLMGLIPLEIYQCFTEMENGQKCVGVFTSFCFFSCKYIYRLSWMKRQSLKFGVVYVHILQVVGGVFLDDRLEWKYQQDYTLKYKYY